VPGAHERTRRRLTSIGAALCLYLAAWASPAPAAPAFAALAVAVVTGTYGRIGAAGGVAIALTAPLDPPVRIALAVAAALSGELAERRRRAGRELAARTFTDRLTGLRNYDFFCEALAAELARVRRYGGCTTLVLLDLDRFKAFNDRHGHAAGNRLLTVVGHAITREKRDADIAARFGGEEFAVLVAGRTMDGIVVAERIRHAIEQAGAARLHRHDVPDLVTASAGVATFPIDARDADELFELADQALYAAKRRGRDCVVTATEQRGRPAGTISRAAV
jgi:diguanylate cyclase (GGDEF)-like protein